MRNSIFIILIVFFIYIALSGCGSKSIEGIVLEETPQTYVLSGEDAFAFMPTVTLYKNGNARLSQPMISSFGIFGMGSYEINGDELTVTHGESTSAVFIISDNGNTLTLKSATLGFTKVGSVYKYRSNADYLKKYNKVEGEKLTLDVLRELAKKAQSLTFADFENYAYVEIDPDQRIFEIDGEYTLTVIYTADGETVCTVECNSSGERFPLHLNGSTGYVFDEFIGIISVPKYETQKWLDYYKDDTMPWNESKELTLKEFPGVTFTWTSEKVVAGDKELFYGMPVWNVFLADLTNDCKPEFCATVSMGSGIVDTHIIVYDYVEGKVYILQDRMYYDYHLFDVNNQNMKSGEDFYIPRPLFLIVREGGHIHSQFSILNYSSSTSLSNSNLETEIS